MAVDPSTLRIRNYPAPELRRRALPVEHFDEELRRVTDRMIELMHGADGIGLAAPQVGLPWRVFVAHLPPAEGRSEESSPRTALPSPTVFANPVLSDPQGPVEPYEEGCLSLPDITGEVLRPTIITITARDVEGREFTQTAGALLARCFQHEFDHLEGILILDRMTQMARLKNRAAVRELERKAGLR